MKHIDTKHKILGFYKIVIGYHQQFFCQQSAYNMAILRWLL